MPIQLLLTVLLLAALVETWRRRGLGALDGRALAGWTLLWCAGIAVTWLPELSDTAARLFGVGRGADLVTYLLLVFLCYVAFRQALGMQKLERDITTLVRHIALEDAVRKMEHGAGDAEKKA
jgi:hypothetical protein